MSGVYIVEFDIYPGIYKIGRSKNIEKRFEQFKNNTAILGDVKLLYQKEFRDPVAAEKSIHQILSDFRYQKNREFFKGDVEQFKQIIDFVYSREADYNYSKFFYTFICESAPLKRIKSAVVRDVLLWLCEYMEVNTNKIYLTTQLRKNMSGDLGKSNNQITNALSELEKQDALKRFNKEIMINPYYYWKGNLNYRTKAIIKHEKIKLPIS